MLCEDGNFQYINILFKYYFSFKMLRSRHDIKFKSGWDRRASLADLFLAGVISEKTVNELEEGAKQILIIATQYHYIISQSTFN